MPKVRDESGAEDDQAGDGQRRFGTAEHDPPILGVPVLTVPVLLLSMFPMIGVPVDRWLGSH